MALATCCSTMVNEGYLLPTIALGGLEVPGCWIAVMRRQGGAILTDLFDLQ